MDKSKTRESEHQNPLGRGLNVLLVDDDEICLFIHQRVLEQSGLCRSTFSAGNGRAALDVLDQALAGSMPYPDIIFLDLQMPVLDGIGFLKAFQQLHFNERETTAVVMLSSSVSEKDRAAVASLGVSHCLAKPFTDEVFKSVLNLLYNWRESTNQEH